ncbi:MAG: winged helix-turn-helix domain-containing protein [Clostridiales bacterium]|nr:winged helix-turn-helix domain-containing protein [Clostridiales bacterium]
MNIRTFKSDKQSLIDEGKRIVSMSDDAKFLRKVTIVNLMLNGASASSLSPSCGETSRTLTSWMKIVDEQGFEALRPKKQSGRPNRLTQYQKEKIKVAVLSSPEEAGYTVWDGPSLSDYINKTYGISLGVRQCQRLFHEFGFSQIRPQTFPSKDHEDDPRRDEFKKTERNLV